MKDNILNFMFYVAMMGLIVLVFSLPDIMGWL